MIERQPISHKILFEVWTQLKRCDGANVSGGRTGGQTGGQTEAGAPVCPSTRVLRVKRGRQWVPGAVVQYLVHAHADKTLF